MSKLSQHQKIVISGYTGILASDFSSFHADVERRMERPVWTHEFANKDFADHLKRLYTDDFIAMCDE